MKKLFYTLFISILFSTTIQAQCIITDIIAEADCENNGMFFVDIDFDFAGTSDSFQIVGNGNNYGTFSYADLFVTIGPFVGDGVTVYEFVIIDSDNPNCTNFTTLGPIDCSSANCEIWDLEVDLGDCNNDNTYDITINFLYQNVNNNFFDLFANGTLIGSYEFSALPLTVSLPVSGNVNDAIAVCVNDNPNCCSILSYEAPNCILNCAITDLVVEPYDCDSSGMFLVDIDFNFTATSDSFYVVGNGNNYGTFSYADLFITLGPFDGNGITEYEFAIIDIDNPDCQSVYELGTVNCIEECELWDLEVDTGDCNNDNTYDLTLNFLYQNVTNNFFDVFANGTFIGFYEFGALPLEIDFPISGNNNDVIEICVNDNPNCCTILEFEAPNCNIDCNITDLIAENYPCDSIGQFLVDIDFNFVGTSDSFQLVGNGIHYGVFAYSDLYITIGPFIGDGITEYEFIIIDSDNPGCTEFVELGPIECVEITDVQNPLTTQLQIFPNPSNDFIFIENKSNIEIEKIELINSVGQLLTTEVDVNSSIDVSNFAEGIYFVKIKLANQEFLLYKLLINN